MFYSSFILTKKGALAKVWLAAHAEHKLSKSAVLAVNIVASCDAIRSSEVPMALRLTSTLLLGTARILARKARYVTSDAADAAVAITAADAAAAAGDTTASDPAGRSTGGGGGAGAGGATAGGDGASAADDAASAVDPTLAPLAAITLGGGRGGRGGGGGAGAAPGDLPVLPLEAAWAAAGPWRPAGGGSIELDMGDGGGRGDDGGGPVGPAAAVEDAYFAFPAGSGLGSGSGSRRPLRCL